MTWDIAKIVLLDALKDSALVFGFVFIIHIIIDIFEDKIARILTKNRVLGPLFGSIFGLVPQCGTSVIGADLYIKKYITLGTLTSIFLACSDEAFILLLTHPSKDTIMVLPLIGIKLLVGFSVGMVIDLLYRKQEILTPIEEVSDVVCEEHHHKHVKLHKYFIHPLVHSLEIFAYVFIINVSLGLIIASVGEANFTNFMLSSKYASPVLASLVGLIPNCASSVFITELFISHHLSFGALVAGLLVNSGLGIVMLLKHKQTLKSAGIVLLISFITAIFIGYIICLIGGF